MNAFVLTVQEMMTPFNWRDPVHFVGGMILLFMMANIFYLAWLGVFRTPRRRRSW